MPVLSSESRRRLKQKASRLLAYVNQHVPPGLRTLLGLLLVAGGMLGFLPVLGFWMIPVGIGVIWLDIRAWRRNRDR